MPAVVGVRVDRGPRRTRPTADGWNRGRPTGSGSRPARRPRATPSGSRSRYAPAGRRGRRCSSRRRSTATNQPPRERDGSDDPEVSRLAHAIDTDVTIDGTVPSDSLRRAATEDGRRRSSRRWGGQPVPAGGGPRRGRGVRSTLPELGLRPDEAVRWPGWRLVVGADSLRQDPLGGRGTSTDVLVAVLEKPVVRPGSPVAHIAEGTAPVLCVLGSGNPTLPRTGGESPSGAASGRPGRRRSHASRSALYASPPVSCSAAVSRSARATSSSAASSRSSCPSPPPACACTGSAVRARATAARRAPRRTRRRPCPWPTSSTCAWNASVKSPPSYAATAFPYASTSTWSANSRTYASHPS